MSECYENVGTVSLAKAQEISAQTDCVVPAAACVLKSQADGSSIPCLTAEFQTSALQVSTKSFFYESTPLGILLASLES